MRLLSSLLTVFIFTVPALAQNANNNVQVISNNTLSFIVDEPSELETDQTISNAIILRMKSKNSNASMFARLSSFTYPAGYVPSGNPLALDWTTDNASGTTNLITGPLPLTAMDQRLFSVSSFNGVADFHYDLTLAAQGYTMVPGNYSFTILFTMTQP